MIDELLSFIQNKLDVMDEASLIQICTTSFSAEEIVSSKSLLFESLPTGKKRIYRKGGNKQHRDLQDMISLFKGMP